jgi:hypothetical protein
MALIDGLIRVLRHDNPDRFSVGSLLILCLNRYLYRTLQAHLVSKVSLSLSISTSQTINQEPHKHRPYKKLLKNVDFMVNQRFRVEKFR